MGSQICSLPFNPFSLVSAFSLSLLVLQVSLLSARAHKFEDTCPRSQLCGNFNITYPFRCKGNISYPSWCGLETIHCINDSTPLLFNDGEEETEESTYEVQSINYTTNTMLLAHDRRFTRDWQSDDQKCNALFNNYTMPPIFRYLSAQLISPNLTLRVCKRRHPQQPYSDDCKIDALPPADAPPPPATSSSRLDECKLVHLPVDVPKNSTIFQYGPVHHVSQLLSLGFRLRWSLPQIRNQCDRNGTVCSAPHPPDNCFCVNPKDGRNQDKVNKSQKKIIRIGIPAGVVGGILLASLLFFIFSKYQAAQNLGQVRRFISLKTDLEKGSTHFGVPIFSYVELEEATNNFSSTNELGDGGFGTVYQGKLRDGRVVAIKRLYPKNSNKHIESFMNEIEILTHLRHQNLVVLYGCTSYYSRELLLVYECVPNGTVADHLHGHRMMVGSLPWPVRMSIAMETASALSYLHASDIIHRDVKTSNILLDNHFHVKVADFGLCRLFPIDASHISTSPQGTPGYVDPEYHRSYQLTDKSDVYSFGVVLIELISSKPAVDITRHRDEINLASMALNKIQNEALQELVDPSLGFETDCNTRRTVTIVAELAFRCLQQERELRPSMDEVLEILTASGVDKEYNMDNAAKVVDIIASYDVESLKNTLPPPAASPDFTASKLVSQQEIPSTNIG